VRAWVFSILGGFALAPVGAVIALVVAYIIVGWRGVTEYQGRRGMLAFLYALLIGAPLGFWGGFKLAWWFCTDAAGPRAAIGLGAIMAIPGVLATGLSALRFGTDLAERRHIGNSASQRLAWALTRIAFPAALLGGAAAFLLAWSLAPISN
jgi:hypothetical protein